MNDKLDDYNHDHEGLDAPHPFVARLLARTLCFGDY
jgi:hypothetical protein